MIIAYLNAIFYIEEELLHSCIFSDTHTYTDVCLYVCVYYYLYIVFMNIAWTFFLE